MARNNHIKSEIPNPLILFSFFKAIQKEIADMQKLKQTPAKSIIRKLVVWSEAKIPLNKNGIVTPTKKLTDNEIASPKYCPRNSELRLTGWASNNSVNSLEL